MPRFGWKCFIGSFLFSLAAVWGATKAYLLAENSAPQTQDISATNLETKDIDLFANTEESNPIIEKFEQLNQKNSENLVMNTAQTAEITPDTSEVEEKVAAVEISAPMTEPEKAEILETPTADDEVLYAPDDDDKIISANETPSATEESSLPSQETTQTAKADITELDIAEANKEELQIADAAEAKPFMIPLVHNFSVPKKDVTISTEADNSQVALASDNVKIQNLGTVNKIAETNSDKAETLEAKKEEPYQNPWEVATVGNAYITKNKIEELKSTQDDIAALDKEKQTAAKSDNETKVAYKMMKNILIPIPEDIANDENLTPQLSYSEENKKLSEKLKKEGVLDAKSEDTTTSAPVSAVTPVPEKAPETTAKTEEPSTSSLTDSIAAWFSNSSSKNKSDSNSSGENSADKGKSGSAFGRLLGLGAKDNSNIAPSELKLSFQPNRAEISGQTLEWLKAFSDNSVKNEDVFVEIRIDGSGSYELQQKRLNLLYSILINNGVDYNKINIIFTDREPNSFIIRNVRYASEEDAAKVRKNAYNPWY